MKRLFAAVLLLFLSSVPLIAQSLSQRIEKTLTRPEFQHAMFGIEFYDLQSNRPVYQLNADKLFTPASTTKLFTEGTALHLLGADYRFHTRVYRTGNIAPDGTLTGDLILVAAGDPDLSGRLQPDGTLAFENEDHSYAGSPDTRAVPGDPLAVIKELAQQVAAKGVKRIAGRVLVDASLFPEGEKELGTGAVISPIVVNDNIVDVTASPAAASGGPVSLNISPQTAYVHFVNRATTGAADSDPEIHFRDDVANPDGSHTVNVTGTMPVGKPPILFAYRVPSPSRFAEMTFVEALRQAGVAAAFSPVADNTDFSAMAAAYTPEDLLAEHVSPPFTQELKVTLKVSQNLHASMMPYFLGASVGHDKTKPLQAGFDLEHDFLQKAGLDLSGASQSDGAGGAQAAFYTPDFVVHYLAYMARQPNFQAFHDALPILGHDGTLYNIQTGSPAAGHVFAKTGTFGAYNALDKNLLVTGKGLAGYVTTQDGRQLAFAIYANRVAVPVSDPEATTKIVGQALGEIAAAAYSAPPERH